MYQPTKTNTANKATSSIKHKAVSAKDQLLKKTLLENELVMIDKIDDSDSTIATAQDKVLLDADEAKVSATTEGASDESINVVADGTPLSDEVLVATSPDIWTHDRIDVATNDTTAVVDTAAKATSVTQSAGLVLGALALGGAALAASGGGGGGAAAVHNVVAGAVVAGPVIAGNGLTVYLYKGDGTTLLGTGKVSDTGTFSVDVGAYTGAVIAKLVDSSIGLDYRDEVTGGTLDLNANFMAVGVANTGTITLNVNALTTVAAMKAGAVFGGASTTTITAEAATQANTAVGSAFGLTDITGSTILTTVNTAGTSQVHNTYGAVLAALSGADHNNAGDSQATIDDLVAGITISGNTATLASTVQAALVQGAVDAGVNNEVAPLIDTTAPVVAITSPTQSNDSTPLISGTAEAGATITVVIAGATYVTTAANGSWSIDTGTAIPTSGTLAVQSGNNSVSVTAADAAANTSTAVTQTLVVNTVDTSIVVFDMIGGHSSSHSNRTFDANVTYTIYILVDGTSSAISMASSEYWFGAGNLGHNDHIYIVGNDYSNLTGSAGLVAGRTGNAGMPSDSVAKIGRIMGNTFTNVALSIRGSGYVYRKTLGGPGTARLWSGNGTAFFGNGTIGPESGHNPYGNQGVGEISIIYLGSTRTANPYITNMMHTQGLLP